MPPPKKGPLLAEEIARNTAGTAVPEIGAHPVPALRATAGGRYPETGKRSRRFWLWISGGILVAGIGIALYFQPWVAKTTAVSLETVALGPVTRVLAVNGRIASLRSVDMRPLVSGTLAEVRVAEGDVVQSGDDLASLDTSAQQAVVRHALAGLDAALVLQDEARATVVRTETLGALVARTVLEDATRAAQSAAQEVARMTALFDQAQIQLGKFTIYAPMAGTVLTLNADPGQAVDLSTVLMTIADLGSLIVETDVDETYATQIRVSQPVALQLAGETTVRQGTVIFVSQRVDEATGGLAVNLAFDMPVVAPIGLTVTANIIVDSRAAAMTVPRAAITVDGQGPAVYIVASGIAHRRAVSVIDWPAARLIVTDGLVLGDMVIEDAAGITEGLAVSEAQP